MSLLFWIRKCVTVVLHSKMCHSCGKVILLDEPTNESVSFFVTLVLHSKRYSEMCHSCGKVMLTDEPTNEVVTLCHSCSTFENVFENVQTNEVVQGGFLRVIVRQGGFTLKRMSYA